MVEWNLWSSEQPALGAKQLKFLRTQLGPLAPLPRVPISAAKLEPSRLSDVAAAAFIRAAGTDAVSTAAVDRARHAGGQSLVDVLRRRVGDAAGAPDAVITPTSARAVGPLLHAASQHGVAVVPWGGGTSVVGGLDMPSQGHDCTVALDLGKLDRLLDVDRESLVATFEPGIRTPVAEAALAAYGLTLGHLPQSYERASLGGYVVTRSAGQASSGVGRIDDLVAGLRLATPVGELTLPALPSSAAGPDLRRLVLGSEGTLGVVTEVSLRVRPMPDRTHYEAWMAPDWERGVAAVRRLAQAGTLPHVLRLSDPDETRMSMRLASTPGWQRMALRQWLRIRGIRGGCLVIAGWEGDRRAIRHGRRLTRQALRDAGAVPIGNRAGESWRRHRFGGPALRDSLLDAGVIVETLETAALWSRLDEVKRATTGALLEALPGARVGCHVSHLYPTGASLYFTVLFAAGSDPAAIVPRWSEAKHAATAALVAAGGTVTHHHGVGTMHRDHAAADLGGEVGRRILLAVKAALDPSGVCNPGKLIG
jgi:alkyldihydroxyacetonephosphate synthase